MLEDLGNTQGFLRALALVLRLKPGALLFAGLPCNSFSFMSQAQHQRSPTSPMGANVGFVVTANRTASRCCLLFLVALVRSTCWALENPARSQIQWFPYTQRLLGLPLFTHAKVFWWWPHLLVVCTLSTVFRSCYMEYCLSSTAYTMTLSSGGWAPMGTPRRSQSWGWGMCTPAHIIIRILQ